MKKQIGLWIDHQKAILVILENDKQEVKHIQSDVEKHVRFRGGAGTKTPYSAQFFSGETRVDRRIHEHLHKYYQQVIAAVNGAEALLVFGDGEAKFEFEKQFKQTRRRVPHVRVETADKMTERQIAAKVRKYFEQ